MIPKWLKIKYDSLSLKDKQFVLMNALNNAGRVLEGTNKTAEEVCEYADYLIERYYLFEATKKPSYGNLPKKEQRSDNNKEQPF